jgi:hypothetical protein
MTHSLSLDISPDIVLPADAGTQKIGWLGISGSGKTYGCGKFVEELIRVGTQTMVLDTIGNWYGLRVSADGKGKGIDIPIIGGIHGDMVLDPAHGKLVAQMFVESGSSMVVDISEFTGGETRRFVIDLATELLVLGFRHPAPRHIVWEECQDIVPQKVFGEDARVLGAVQRLIKKGRNCGYGHSLISQRVAAVNKEVLYQCHTLFSFRTIGKLDRKSIEDYINDHDTDLTGPRPPLSKLATGRCLVYSPEWLKVSKEIGIGKKRTFDASATPDFSRGAPKALTLSKVDLKRFKAKMADAIEKAKDNDPEELKKKIRELEGKVSNGTLMPVDPALVERMRQNEAELQRVRARLEMITAKTKDFLRGLAEEASAFTIDVFSATAYNARDVVQEKIDEAAPPLIYGAKRVGSASTDAVMASAGVMPPAIRAFLTVLAQRGYDEGVKSLAKSKILKFADYAAGGPVSKAFATMVREGWAVAPSPGELSITKAGRKALGQYTPLPVGDALYQHALQSDRLGNPGKAFLRELGRHYPREVSKADILKATGYAAGGPVSKEFAKLVALEYAVSVGPARLRLSDDLTSNPVRRA